VSSDTKYESLRKSEIEKEMKGHQFEDKVRVFTEASGSTEDILKSSGQGNSLNPRNASNVHKFMQRTLKSTKRKRNRNVRNNFTYMFITIIVCYILSYLPTFVAMLLATGDPFLFWYSMNTIELNIVMLMRRSSIINHIANPIIYGYFDVAFRKAFMKLFNCRSVDNLYTILEAKQIIIIIVGKFSLHIYRENVVRLF
jgi:hypothetical protein